MSTPKKRALHWGIHFVVMLVLLMGSGVGILWYLSLDRHVTGSNGDVPLVLADKTPFKEQPEDPGGMDVPGRGRLIYEQLETEGAEPTVEHLLPPPEAPLPPPSSDAEMIAEFKDGQMVTPPVAEPPQPSAPAAAPPPPAPPAPVVETPPPPAPAPEPAPEPAPALPAPAPPVSSGEYLVQLASVRAPEAVEAEWKRLKTRHPDLLGGLELHMERADLGPDKGVFFRLRAGPLSEAGARTLCGQLKQVDIPCLPVSAGE